MVGDPAANSSLGLDEQGGAARRRPMKRSKHMSAEDLQRAEEETEEGELMCWLCGKDFAEEGGVWKWRGHALHKGGCASALRCHNTLLRQSRDERIKAADAKHLRQNPESWKQQVMFLKAF